MAATFDPTSVDLTANNTDLQRQVTCFFQLGKPDYDGHEGVRISALFVILIVSSAATFFPVLAARVRWVRVPLYVYLFARYFGAGVIVATAFIHLLDPAYSEIGPQTCVGMTGGWASYSWPPAICLTAVIVIFSMDLAAERYVEAKYGMAHGHVDVEGLVTQGTEGADAHRLDHQFLHNFDQMSDMERHISRRMSTQRQLGPVYAADVLASSKSKECDEAASTSSDVAAAANADPEAQRRKHAEAAVSEKVLERAEERSFQTQIAAFLILEFGVIFHSVIIGLNLGTAGQEFATLYPVLVFHQSFEGLGIGARMSAIPFPRRLRLMPWFLCAGYGLTTPIAIGIGLGLKSTYNGNSYVAFVISGVLDSISAGILIYTGLVELLARDFLFDPDRTKDNKRLTFMMICVLFGAGIMALLGKWA